MRNRKPKLHCGLVTIILYLLIARDLNLMVDFRIGFTSHTAIEVTSHALVMPETPASSGV
jgi:hypothetical protein